MLINVIKSDILKFRTYIFWINDYLIANHSQTISRVNKATSPETTWHKRYRSQKTGVIKKTGARLAHETFQGLPAQNCHWLQSEFQEVQSLPGTVNVTLVRHFVYYMCYSYTNWRVRFGACFFLIQDFLTLAVLKLFPLTLIFWCRSFWLRCVCRVAYLTYYLF